MRRAGLHRHAAGHLAHRREEGQRALRLERLVGDGVGAGLHEGFGQLAGRGEVEIGENDLAALDHRPLLRERLLDLHDHVGLRPDVGRVRADLRPSRLKRRVGDAGLDAGVRLDDHLVAAPNQRIVPISQ